MFARFGKFEVPVALFVAAVIIVLPFAIASGQDDGGGGGDSGGEGTTVDVSGSGGESVSGGGEGGESIVEMTGLDGSITSVSEGDMVPYDMDSAGWGSGGDSIDSSGWGGGSNNLVDEGNLGNSDYLSNAWNGDGGNTFDTSASVENTGDAGATDFSQFEGASSDGFGASGGDLSGGSDYVQLNSDIVNSEASLQADESSFSGVGGNYVDSSVENAPGNDTFDNSGYYGSSENSTFASSNLSEDYNSGSWATPDANSSAEYSFNQYDGSWADSEAGQGSSLASDYGAANGGNMNTGDSAPNEGFSAFADNSNIDSGGTQVASLSNSAAYDSISAVGDSQGNTDMVGGQDFENAASNENINTGVTDYPSYQGVPAEQFQNDFNNSFDPAPPAGNSTLDNINQFHTPQEFNAEPGLQNFNAVPDNVAQNDYFSSSAQFTSASASQSAVSPWGNGNWSQS